MPHLRFDPGMVERFEREFGEGWQDELIPDRGRRRLGIGIQDLTPQLAEYFGAKNGVLVTTVDEKSAAAAAGLKAGDVITAVDGKPVTSRSEVQRAIRRASDQSEITISYMRDRKSGETKAKLPERERPGRMTRPA
jgi:S1-C subfamily serine protease